MIVSTDMTQQRTSGSAIALGFFDGVHIGHRKVISTAVEEARHGELVPCVFTFQPSGAVPASKKTLTLLRSEVQKEEILRELGVREVVCPDFSAFQDLSPQEFVERLLIGTLRAQVLVCGEDYRFGKYAAAGIRELEQLAAPYGVRVIAVPAVAWEGEVVSSTRIRAAVREGKMELAAQLLGAPFTVEAPVLRGRQVGRVHRAPTVNQRFPDGFTIPRYGVYFSRTRIGQNSYFGITNVGVKPTFQKQDLTCETNLFGYHGRELYGVEIAVSLLRFMRPEIHFDSVEALYAQINSDVAEARRMAQGDDIGGNGGLDGKNS